MAPINSNYIKSGSTIQNAVTKNTTFNVGVFGGDDYGPTNRTGFYKGIIPPPGGYTIYMHKESQGPSIHVAHDDEQCIFFLKSFGATGSTISEVLAWSTGRTDIWVQTQEITLEDLSNNTTPTPIPATSTPTPTSTSTPLPATSTPTPTSTSTPLPATSTPTPTLTNTPTPTPNIVSSDLILHLDANNSSSYGGSGNTWVDIAGTQQNITLIGSPTFTSGSPSYFTFNGTNQYGSGSGTVLPTTGYTKSVWVYLNGYQDNNIVSGGGHFIFMGAGGTDHKIYCGHSNWGNYIAYPSTNTVNLNTWYNLTLTFNTTDGMKLYINGVLDSTYTARKTAHPGSGTVNLATYVGGNLLNGRISKVYCYGRSLTSQEVSDNYNNDAPLFGLSPIPTPTSTSTPLPATSTPTPTSTSTPLPATSTPTPTSTSTPTPTIVSAVSSGLELYYDPSNSSSYPGSGTTLYDLSPSAVNATLSGSPTDSGNWFTFTGTQSIQTGNLFSLFSGWQHSLEIWFSPSAAGLVFADTNTGPTNTGYHASGLEVYQTGPFYNLNAMLWNGTAVTRVGGGIPTLNSWYQLVRVYNGSNTAYAYLNKVKSSDTSITWSTPSSGWYLNFGSSESTFFATGSRFQGKIGVIRLYNRVLTQSEITQNFDAEKSKYGL